MSDADGKPPIVVLVGSTAIGKTAAAVALCEAIDGEIVGADSVQVYRELDIGAGKPSAAELRGVRHHLIDILEPTERLDAARYAELADAVIAGVHARGRVPVVAGGTGLWLRALLRGLVALPKVDPALRARLERSFAEQGGETLHARLATIDPLTAARVHPSDMVRVVRALEVHEQTGRPLGELRLEHALGAPRYPAYTLLLELPLQSWRARVSERTARMFEAGFVAEVHGLLERYGTGLRALRAVGYRQIADGLAANLTEVEMQQRVLSATLVYGRRQRNWFRTDPSVTERVSALGVLDAALRDRLHAHLGR
jgi:tRNA dimethylallyltransferase